MTITRKIVRASKYRHVFGSGSKKEACYDGARVSLDSNDWHLVKANTRFMSIHWDSVGGGSFLIHPHSATGRLANNPPLYTGHTGPVLDTDFHPFNEQVIASAGEDGRILLWNIPEQGPTEPSNKHVGELKGHERRIIDLSWNPAVNSLISSASHDMTVRIWDVTAARCKVVLSGHFEAALDQCWSLMGDRLATSCRDKDIRVFDPRKDGKAVLSKSKAHPGIKGTRVAWLGTEEQLVTTGFGRASEREVSLWDCRRFDSPITTLTVDSASGPLLPYYDADCKILYLGGRGDGNIRYYEMIPEEPYFYFLSEYKSTDPQRGLALLPKRAVNTAESEIARFIKVYGSQPILEPISFKVPRRSNSLTNDAVSSEIYPETLAAEPTMSVQEYFEGINRPPRRVSIVAATNNNIASCPGFILPKATKEDNQTEEPKTEETLSKAYKLLKREMEQLKNELDQKTVRIRQLEALINKQ